MRWDGALDAVHIHNFHTWNFGFPGGVTSVYGDGNNVCMELGRIDGLMASDIACFMNSIVYTANAAQSKGIYTWSNVLLDGGAWTQAAGYALVSNMQQTGPPNTGAGLQVSGGLLSIENYFLCSSQVAPSIVVSGGTLKINNGWLGASNPSRGARFGDRRPPRRSRQRASDRRLWCRTLGRSLGVAVRQRSVALRGRLGHSRGSWREIHLRPCYVQLPQHTE